MTVQTVIHKISSRLALLGACGGLGASALVFIVALAVGGDQKKRSSEPQGTENRKPTENADDAATGFNNLTNGFEDQTAFDADRKSFETVEEIVPDGLGPVYNATSCVSCHQNPVTGSSSQVAELRAGRHIPDPNDPKKIIFVEPPGGSLVHQRAINAAAQEHVRPKDDVRTLRMSTNILGNGYVEIISDDDILKYRDSQPDGLKGLPIGVPVVVSGKKDAQGKIQFEFEERIGRFGWKCQEASLLNFSAGAYLNEMGITNPLQPNENTSNGRDVSQFDLVPDPEDKVDPKDPDHPFGKDVMAFTRFMRSTKPPSRDLSFAAFDDVQEGEKIFRDNKKLGCAVCHRPDYTTPESGTRIKPLHPGSKRAGSDLGSVPAALANQIIHPFSDFMLHDIGTGDGIVQSQHAQDPPRGAENREKLPDEVRARLGIARIVREKFRPEDGRKRLLRPDTGLDQRTINMMRTAPLWGLRVRPQMMHDGLSLTLDDAIRRHQGDAAKVTQSFFKLTQREQEQVKAFLNSL